MRREVFEHFLNQKVKLVKENFVLYGRITEVGEDHVLFETNTMTSAISMDVVKEIIPMRVGQK